MLLILIQAHGQIFWVRIKIFKAKEVNTIGQPGFILNENFTIACSKNAIQVLELQKEGKKDYSSISKRQ